jgi:hypothetical protein
MDMTFDPFSWRGPARDSGVGDALGINRPEWRALAARLAAAHAFQRHGAQAARAVAMYGAPMESRMGTGSFHAATARALAGFHGEAGGSTNPDFYDETPRGFGGGKMLAAVNPTSSADRKNTSGIVSIVAGPPSLPAIEG